MTDGANEDRQVTEAANVCNRRIAAVRFEQQAHNLSHLGCYVEEPHNPRRLIADDEQQYSNLDPLAWAKEPGKAD